MDNFGEGYRLLEALARCNDDLAAFGYSLFIQYQRNGWIGKWTRNQINVSGTPFTFYDEVYQRCFILGFGIQASSSVTLSFGIYFCWDREFWMVRADVDFTDDAQDDTNYHTLLWSHQLERTLDIDKAITLLYTMTQEIINYSKEKRLQLLIR